MRIGVYTGSFNPVHNVHLEVARKVLDDGVVDRWFLFLLEMITLKRDWFLRVIGVQC